MNRNIGVFFAACFAGYVVTACEGGSGAGTAGTLTPTISNLTTGTTAVEVSTGTSALVTFSLSRGGSYDGVVTMSVDGLPSSVTATFDPPGLGVQDPTGKVRFTAASNAPAGSYPVTLRAIGPNVTAVSTALTVKVSVPGVDVKVGTAPISVVIDSLVTVPITITRTGGLFDPVTLSAINLPTGINATFSPAIIATDATTSTMTLSAAITTALGANPITVRATAIGNVDARTNTPVTVLDAATPTYRILGLPIIPPDVKVTETVQVPFTLARAGGFTAPVALTAENLPTGVTATFSPASATTGSTISLSPSSAATEATTLITVRGKSAGLTDRTATFSLHVIQVLGMDIRFSQAFALARSTSAQLLGTLQHTGGYSLGFTVTIEGLPTGVTTNSFPIIVGTGTGSSFFTAILVADGTVIAGTYPITFRMRGTDGLTQTKVLTLTITD